MNKKGLLIVVSAPAGCGKDTILEKIVAENDDLVYSISATTRAIRENEVDGVNYYFKTRGEFNAMIKNDEFLEHAEYVGNSYGTPKAPVLEKLEEGKNVILKIEVQGARNIKKIYPECVSIFILPPSISELERRLTKRGTEDTFTIQNRLKQAQVEIAEVKNYDYAIINDDLDDAVSDLLSVIKAEKFSIKRGIPEII